MVLSSLADSAELTPTRLRGAQILGLLVALCLLSAPNFAGPSSDTEEGTLSETEFVLGNVAFALMHELAHILITEHQIPMLGPEESAADQIATTFLVRGEGSDPEQSERLRQYAGMAALAFASVWEFANEIDVGNPYWDDHGLSIQRYYRVLCLIHGSDPAGHPHIPTPNKLPDERAQACMLEFEKANRAVEWLLDTYGVASGDSAGASIEITYQEPRTKVEERLLADIRERRLIELIVEAFQQRFALQRPFQVAMRSCGKAEAGWNSTLRELAICYELLDAYQVLYIRASSARG